MKDTIVIYKSNYGSTKKYAQWISKALDCDLSDVSKINMSALQDYRTVIYGGGLYASGILGAAFMTKNFDALKNKNLIVFTVGLANPQIKEQFGPVIDKNFTKKMQESIRFFHLRGGIDYKNIGLVHKTMMSLLKNKVDRIEKEKRDDEMEQLLETYGQTVDFTDEAMISELVSYCKSL